MVFPARRVQFQESVCGLALMDYALAGLIGTVAAALVTWLFRTPKEDVDELRQRTATLEGKFAALSTDYAGVHGRHDEALRQLTSAVTRLTDRFDAFMGNGHNGRR